MKKLFYLASIAALAFSSCSKDDTTGAVVNTKSGGFTISASVVSDDATTRNYLGEVDGELTPLWSKTDVIAAFSDGTASEGVFHQNVPFAIDPFDAGLADADFLNQENGLALLGGKNLLFYYPYNAKASLPEGLWNDRDSKTDVATFNADKVDFLEIKAQQGYMDGSFISNMAPSVGTMPVSAVEFEDGTAVADVHLVPVVDYLVFKAVGTRPIEKITLQLRDNVNNVWLPIAGEGVLQEYVVDANNNKKADAGEATRYYWVANEGAGITITLQPGTMTDAVCHEENEYVFVVPGGILGAKKNIMARFEVFGDGTSTKFDYGYGCDDEETPNSDAAINGDKVGDVEYWRHITAATDAQPMLADRQLENVVFYAQAKDENGVREPAEFNPEGDVIIRDQIDLLQYFEEYQAALEDMQYAANPAVNVSTGEIEVEEDGLKDAYICNNHAFDFSPEALGALATEYRKNNIEAKFNKYINKYHIYGFPCVDRYYNKFRGNGTEENPTVISNVKLASMGGLFGQIHSAANISGVTFENIAAAEMQVPVEQTRAAVETETETLRGVILGIEALHKGVFGKGVKVVNPTAYAIVGFAKAGNYAAIELDGITSNLEHIFAVLEAEAGIDLSKTWAEASKVNGSIFELIAPERGEHTVFNVDNIASSAANYAKLTSKVLLEPYRDQKVVGVASVVLGGESWWTGGQIEASQAKNAKATDPYLVKYAEQLAYGQPDANGTYKLTCNMNLNWENLSDVEVNGVEYDDVPWVGDVYAAFNNFDGDNKTVKGVVMKSVDDFNADEYADSKIAPFAFMNVKNLIVDGVDIDILTAHKDVVVPEYIAGLSKTAKNVDNVTVKNVKFNAHGKNSLNKGASYNDEDNKAVKAGWIIASAEDMKISNSTVENVESNIEALTAMVARVKLTKSNINAQFINNTVNMSTVSILDEDMYAIEDFAKYKYADHKSAYSDIVAQVWVGNNAGEVGIKFNDFDSEPRFLVNINLNKINNKLVVYLNNLAKYIFPKDFPVEE